MLCRNGLHDVSQPGSRRQQDGKCAACYREKRRRAERTGRPNGRPSISFKSCPEGHEILRRPNGQWRKKCGECGRIRLAAYNAERAARARAFWASPKGAARRAAIRDAAAQRSKERRLTTERKKYETAQKARRRATIDGQLVLARQQVRERIAYKEARIAELERELQYANA